MSKFEPTESLKVIRQFIDEYRERIKKYEDEAPAKSNLPSFAYPRPQESKWVQGNYERFLKDTPNEILVEQNFLKEMGYITALAFTQDGSHIIVAHSTGLIQVRHSSTGRAVSTLRHIQFPPRPVYALQCVGADCYAASVDGVVYKLHLQTMGESSSQLENIHMKREWDSLNVQFFSDPNVKNKAHAFLTSRSPALSLGATADRTRLAVGYADTSIKLYDIGTQEVVSTYKVHKLRLQFTAKRLQRMHTGQVAALVCHPERANVFASAAWDGTLRVWDTRCRVGCMMTFEGVNVCSDSIDLSRDLCIAGSWQPLDALTLWDLRARKRLSIINAQNRRPDVDGEYIHACRFWKSNEFNRKGKYAIIGGSGTSCLELINLHNRYVACSFPARGAVLAAASHGENVAYGGTSTIFSVVSFHDPKHEEEAYDQATEDVANWVEVAFAETYEGEEQTGYGGESSDCGGSLADVEECESLVG